MIIFFIGKEAVPLFKSYQVDSNKNFLTDKEISENIIDFLKRTKNNRTSFLVELGSNHEQQHQELMLMDIKNIFCIFIYCSSI